MQDFGLPSSQVYTPEIRFVDIDAAGIVNNATYFNYFEQSRISFFEPLLGKKWDWNAAGMVVARHEIDYRVPILFNDDVRIVTWIEHVGTKSMTAAYEVFKKKQGSWVLAAQAKTVLVSYNHSEGKPAPWAADVIEAAEGFGYGRPDF
ncbi:MAG: thioesterase [Crocinitomicaceae bacterium]|nr:thioesterase [Crocinitomicaceae bacterium]